jgi:hypothetical protein
MKFRELFAESLMPHVTLTLQKIVKNGGLTDPTVEVYILANLMQLVKDSECFSIDLDGHNPTKEMIDAVKALSKKEIVDTAQFFIDKIHELEDTNTVFNPLMDAGEWIRWATEGQGA